MIFLGLLGVALIGSFLAHSRLKRSQVAQQAMIWVLIFVGAVAGVGLWQDMKGDILPQQTSISAEQIELPRARDGHYHLTLDINGTPVDFLVDTGATQVVLTQQDAARIGFTGDDLRFIGTANTANGTVRTAPVRLDTVQLGEIKDFNLPASVNGGEMDKSLLGMSYLSRFSSIEIRGDRLILTR